MENYLDQLNEQQRQAVEYIDGPALVIAGAGSGKTRVLTYKIVHLLHKGFKPNHILALTFTNKAAREMKERIEKLVGTEVASQLWMGTFHSIFARILRINAEKIGFRHDFTIYDTADSRSLIKLIVRDMQLDDKVYKPATLQAHISKMKNALFSPADYAQNHDFIAADDRAGRPLTAQIYSTYWQRCRVAGAMDFDDLLFNTNILLRDNDDVRARYQEFFSYILVDEYQDTNFAQHMIVRQLIGAGQHLCVVGDDAQSIYSFRGANISNILNLQHAFPALKTFKLEQNYRSTQTIIEAANSLIAKNKHQIKKHIFSNNDLGRKVPVLQCYSDYDEAYAVASNIMTLKAQTGCTFNDFAVLYRTNAQSRVLEEALGSGGLKDKHGHKRRSIPYRIYGGLSFYQRKEVKDAIAYFRLCINPDDDEALRRVINYPLRGIGDTTTGKVQHCAVNDGVSMWQVITHPAQHALNVNSGTLSKLQSFAKLIQGFIDMDKKGLDAITLATHIIEETKLISCLNDSHTPENISKQENLNELLSSVNDFVLTETEQGNHDVQMTHYLAQISLATDMDEKNKNDGDCVTLMTIHAAKGLEFKNVFIVGVEEDLFPSAMSKDSIDGLEEERRLMYVAITRAKENCVISYAQSRFRNGQTVYSNPSRFIRDIDPQFLLMGGSSQFLDNDKPEIKHVRTTHRPSPTTFKPRFSDPSSNHVAPQESGNFTIHTLNELCEGLEIMHNRFGKGVITTIDETGADPKIVVRFENVGVKTLLIKFAKFEIL